MKELCCVLSEIESVLLDKMKTSKISSDKESYFNFFIVKAKLEYDIKKRCDQIFAKYSSNFKKTYKFQKKFTDLITEFFDKYTKIFNNIFNSLNETVSCYYKVLSSDIIEGSNEVKQHVLDKIFNTKIKLKKKSEQPKDFLNIILQDEKNWYYKCKNSVYNDKVITKVSSYIFKLKNEYMDKQKSVSKVEMSINNSTSVFKNLTNDFNRDKNAAKFQNEVLKQAISNAYSKLKQDTRQTIDTCKDLKSNNEIDKKTFSNNNHQINTRIADINKNKIVKGDIEQALLNKASDEFNEKFESKVYLVENKGRENKNTFNKSSDKKNKPQEQEIIDMEGFDCKENADKHVIDVEESVLDVTIDKSNEPTDYMGHAPSRSICSSDTSNTTIRPLNNGPDLACADKIKETSLISNKNTINIMEDLDKKILVETTKILNGTLSFVSEFDIIDVQEEETSEIMPVKTIIDNEKEERADQNEIIENKQVRITEYNINKAKKNMHNNKSNKKSKKKKKIPTKKLTTDCNDDSVKKTDPN
ncbi:hypothetical protein COBT_003534, partial [Conglomerata obtusa]